MGFPFARKQVESFEVGVAQLIFEKAAPNQPQAVFASGY